METAQELDGSAATLAALAGLRRDKMQVERDIVSAAVRYAEIRNGQTARTGATPTDSAMPGMERTVRIGGAGTPEVAEFAAADVAAELEISPYAARSLMADGLDIQHRHPQLWARLQACEVPVWVARKIAAATRDLSKEGAALVDRRVTPYADGRLGWSRLCDVLDAAVIEADPEAAAERERRAAEDKFAKVGRSNDHGQKTLYVRDHAAAIVRVDATIAFIAEALRALGDTDDENTRRVKALAVMANPLQAVQLLAAYQARFARSSGPDRADGTDEPLPRDPQDPESSAGGDPTPESGTAADGGSDDNPDGGGTRPGDAAAFVKPEPFRPSDIPCCRHAESDLRAGGTGGGEGNAYTVDWAKLLPAVTLYLHLAATPPGDGGDPRVGNVVRWEGEGPISTQYLRDVIGPLCRFNVKPVIDLNDHVAVTAYETPEWMRERLHLVTGGDVYPYASSTSRRLDMDHCRPYEPPDDGGPPGQTNPDNLGPLTRFHHRLKTHGGWQVWQPCPGTYLWRAPHGSIFLVDHTGTRKINEPWSRGPSSRPAAPRSRAECHFAELVLSA